MTNKLASKLRVVELEFRLHATLNAIPVDPLLLPFKQRAIEHLKRQLNTAKQELERDTTTSN